MPEVNKQYLNKTEYQRALATVSNEFDKVTYLGETVGQTEEVTKKKLSVSPRQSIIVGRCIPLHPRKGKKYYFKDGIIKVMVSKGELGADSRVAFYYASDLTAPINVINCITSWPNVPIGEQGQPPTLVEIIEESPKGKATFNLATMARVRKVTIDNSITESPFIEIAKGKVIVTETPRPSSVSLHQYTLAAGVVSPWIKVRSLAFRKGSVVAYSTRMVYRATNFNKIRIMDIDAWETASYIYRPKRSWAIPKNCWHHIKLGDGEQVIRQSFRGECVVFSLRRGRVGYKPLYMKATHYGAFELPENIVERSIASSRLNRNRTYSLAIMQYKK